MKTLIHFNETGFTTYVKRFDLPLNKFKAVLNAWKALNIGSIDTAEFQDLFDGKIDDVMFEKMTQGQEMSVMGIKLNKKKFLDLVERPDGYGTLISTIEELKKLYSIGDNYSGSITQDYHLPESYEIANDELIVSPSLLEAKKESDFSFYVTSAKQKQVFDLLNNFVKGLNELANKGLHVSDSHQSNHCLDNFLEPLRHSKEKCETIIDYSSLNSILKKFKH